MRLRSPYAGGATAVIARIPTIDLQGAVIETLALLSFRGRMPLTGGEPLIHDGGVVGGVGSSNGEPADDAAICTAAGKAFAELT